MVTFTAAGVRLGMRHCAPLLIGVTPFGLVVGILSHADGLSWVEAALMSASVYGGSAQLLALGQWDTPAPVVGATIAAFIVNLRLALMGPVLAPWLDQMRGWRLWGSLFVMADQNWAMAVRQMRAGASDVGYLFGSGAIMWAVWVVTTVMGFAVGAAFRPPSGHPLFFSALAVFVAMLVTMWRGRRDLVPWVVAACVAAIVSRVAPGTIYIIAGALAGSITGAVRDHLRARSG